MPEVSEVWLVEKQPRGGHWWRLWRRAIGRRWRHVVDLRGSAFAYTVWAGRRTVLHTDRTLRHRVAHLTEVLGASEPVAPRICWRPEHAREADRLLVTQCPVLAIGPTANWRGKQWPAAKFGELAARLTGPDGPLPGARVLVAGAPNEAPMAQTAIAALPPERTIAAFGWPLPVLAAAFSKASLYVGNDSGLMHLAAAVGVPALGLFGPSRDEHYAPWGAGNRVVRTPTSYGDYLIAGRLDTAVAARLMDDIPVEEVYCAAVGLLEASERRKE